MDYIKPNFYDASHLISQGFILQKIEIDEKNRTQYCFDNIDLIELELKEFKENKSLKCYIDGIIKLRKMIKNERNKQRLQKNKEKNKQSNTN